MEGNPFFEDYYYEHIYLDYFNKDKAHLWSVISAYAHKINYNYSYLVYFLNLINQNYDSSLSYCSYKSIEIPTEEEFLEILEFRESEINRVIQEYESLKLTIIDPKYWEKLHDWEYWQWPNEWGIIDWNEPIFNHIEEYNTRGKKFKGIHGNPFTKKGEDNHPAWMFESNKSENELKTHLWSIISAYSHTIDYNYDYLVTYIKFRNKRYENESYYRKLSIPTEKEFLEIIEFRESELNRIYNNIDNMSWNWPNKWGKVSWNSDITHYIDEYDDWDNPTNQDLKKRLNDSLETIRNEIKRFKIYLCYNGDYYLKRKKDASIFLKEEIYRFKIYLGHNSEYKLNTNEINYLVKTFNFFTKNNSFNLSFPKIIISLDMPISLIKMKKKIDIENNEKENIKWDINGILGQFIDSFRNNNYWTAGKDTKIIIYKRAIRKCSESLSILEPSLTKIVLIHEFFHFLIYLLYKSKKSIKYKTVSSELHETFAQFFTYFTLNYNLESTYYTKSNYTNTHEPEKNPFNILLKHQSTKYNKFKDILTIFDNMKCSNIDRLDKIVNSIDELIEIDNATLSDWINLLK